MTEDTHATTLGMRPAAVPVPSGAGVPGPADGLVAADVVTLRDAEWERFLAWERAAAKNGSGMTREQMTGATMLHMWLGEQAVRADATRVAEAEVAWLRKTLDGAYTERNRLVAALIAVGGYPAVTYEVQEEPSWWVVYLDTPAGQLSWHVGINDIGLFLGAPGVIGSPWDGHDTDEKYRRLAALAAVRADATRAAEAEVAGLRASEVVRMLEGIKREVEVMGEDGECSLRTIKGVQYVTKDDVLLAVDSRLGVVRLRALAAQPAAPEAEPEPGWCWFDDPEGHPFTPAPR